ncbi:hypothetical protein ACFX19_015980 [Malus domestica]
MNLKLTSCLLQVKLPHNKNNPRFHFVLSFHFLSNQTKFQEKKPTHEKMQHKNHKLEFRKKDLHKRVARTLPESENPEPNSCRNQSGSAKRRHPIGQKETELPQKSSNLNKNSKDSTKGLCELNQMELLFGCAEEEAEYPKFKIQ